MFQVGIMSRDRTGVGGLLVNLLLQIDVYADGLAVDPVCRSKTMAEFTT